MQYHPLMGISIFIMAIILSFILGRKYIKKKPNNNLSKKQNSNKSLLPKGEITAPDAPWLDKNK